MVHSDGGKGSGRRKEDASKIRDNWDLIFGAKAPMSSPTAAGLTEKENTMNEQTDYHDEDGEVICDVCGSEMSATEHGLYLFCDVCGHREEFLWDDSKGPDIGDDDL
jgi:hypothetical protein